MNRRRPREHKRKLRSSRYSKMRGRALLINKGITNSAYKRYLKGKKASSIPSRLKPFSDYDKDGRPNLMDCYPFNKNRHGRKVEKFVYKFDELDAKAKEKAMVS